MKLAEITTVSSDWDKANKRVLKIKRFIADAKKRNTVGELSVKSLEPELIAAIKIRDSLKKRLDESSIPLRDPVIEAVAQKTAKFVGDTAKAMWQQSAARNEYSGFDDWFKNDYLANSRNIDAVIDNVAGTIKDRVINLLYTPS